MIEKAYKKLRLDALVIQQGRLVENTKSVNKEDLLNMVRYGAERVFSSEASNITEEDVDALIAKVGGPPEWGWWVVGVGVGVGGTVTSRALPWHAAQQPPCAPAGGPGFLPLVAPHFM